MAAAPREDDTEQMKRSAAEFAGAASRKLKTAGVDTDVMANQAGELQRMIAGEIAARPFQAVALAAFIGFLYGITR